MPAEYDAQLDVCGEIYFLRRTMAMLRRVEQRFGPLTTLFRALEASNATQSTICDLYLELIRGADDMPDKAKVAAWVYEQGSWACCRALALFVANMAVGSAQLRALEDRKMAAVEESGANPTQPRRGQRETAASPSPA